MRPGRVHRGRIDVVVKRLQLMPQRASVSSEPKYRKCASSVGARSSEYAIWYQPVRYGGKGNRPIEDPSLSSTPTWFNERGARRGG